MQSRHRDIFAFLALALIALAITLPFATQEQIRDSLFWARVVENGSDLYSLLNPHHLVYLPINLVIYKLLSPICPACSGIAVGMIHSLLAYILSLGGMYLLIRRLTESGYLAWLAALLLLFSGVTWIYSMQVSPYVPMLACLVWLSWVVVRLEEASTPSRLAALAGLFALTVLYHQAAVVLSLPILLFFLQRQGIAGLRTGMAVLVGAGSVVLIAYLAAYVLVEQHWSIHGLIAYTQRYSSIPIPSFSTLDNYTWSNLRLLLQLHLEGFALLPWRLRATASYAFIAALLLLSAWHIRAIATKAMFSAFRLFSLTWLWLLVALYLWANPTEKEYFSINYAPLLALLFLGLRDLTQCHRRFALLPVALLALFTAYAAYRNFNDDILRMAASKGKDQAIAGDIAAITPPHCMVLHENQLVMQNLNYYFHIRARDLWDILNYYFYAQGKPTPFTWLNFSFSEAACYVIPASTILPQANVSGKSGNDLPAQWFAFTRWLFGIRSEGTGSQLIHQTDAVRDAHGRLYFIVTPHDAALPDATAWAGYLDHALAQAAGKESGHYTAWLRQFPAVPSAGAARPLP